MRPVRLNSFELTHINDLISVVDLKPLLGDGGHFPLGIVIAVRFIHIDDVFSQLCHFGLSKLLFEIIMTDSIKISEKELFDYFWSKAYFYSMKKSKQI
jgi:hypothetical protein